MFEVALEILFSKLALQWRCPISLLAVYFFFCVKMCSTCTVCINSLSSELNDCWYSPLLLNKSVAFGSWAPHQRPRALVRVPTHLSVVMWPFRTRVKGLCGEWQQSAKYLVASTSSSLPFVYCDIIGRNVSHQPHAHACVPFCICKWTSKMGNSK